MEQVPKIVRERLKVVTPAVTHPDAGVLTAFSERSLPDLERATVLDHLARCSECREVLALSLPANEVIQLVPQPVPGGWFAWPTLRWGFVAAGILLVASLGVLQYRKQVSPATIALKATPPAVADEEARSKTLPLAASPEAANKLESSAVLTPSQPIDRNSAPARAATGARAATAPVRRDEPTSSTGTAAVAGKTYHGSLTYGPKVANQMQLNANAQQQQSNAYSFQASAPAPPLSSPKQQVGQQVGNLSAKARVPTASQHVDVSAEAAAPDAAQNDKLQTLVVSNQPLDQQKLDGGQAESKVDRAKPAGIVIGSAKVPGGSAPVLGGPLRANLYTSDARWSITSAGGLQRSLDQGNTWQDVNITNASPAAPASLTLAVNGLAKEELDDKDAQKNNLKLKNELKKSTPASIVFRAVSANGADVWAGGSAGMLYHSTDAGAQWTRVIPSFAGATLTGEILTVAFTDPRHGRISTSTSEVWITEDAGQTWQKQ